jgi:capsular polysaccharide biosynthesis protein
MFENSSGRILDTAFILLGERSHEFPAWHHEVLPKLRWLEKYSDASGESPTLVVSGDLKPFHKWSLQLMGYDPDNWVEAGGRIRVRRLVVPPHPLRAKGTHLHTTPHGWVADRMLSNVAGPMQEFSNRIYISRRDAGRRQIRNEDEVRDALADYGFEWYEPGRLDYEEEIALFAEADHIVGAHGKGLASMFYADDATFLELFPKRGATEHYFLTAQECGFEYEFLTCEPVPTEQNVRARDRDIHVDIDELCSRVAALI